MASGSNPEQRTIPVFVGHIFSCAFFRLLFAPHKSENRRILIIHRQVKSVSDLSFGMVNTLFFCEV